MKILAIVDTIAIVVVASIQAFNFYQAQRDRAVVIAVANQVAQSITDNIEAQEKVDLQKRINALNEFVEVLDEVSAQLDIQEQADKVFQACRSEGKSYNECEGPALAVFEAAGK